MNNSRFSVYRGDFRKFIKACEFTHVGVFMRTRRVDSRFAAYRIVPICWQEMPVHPTLWVCRLCVIWDHYTRDKPFLSQASRTCSFIPFIQHVFLLCWIYADTSAYFDFMSCIITICLVLMFFRTFTFLPDFPFWFLFIFTFFAFISIHSYLRVSFLQCSLSLCTSIPIVPEGQFKKERYVSDRTRTSSLVYILFLFFFSLLLLFIRINPRVLNQF